MFKDNITLAEKSELRKKLAGNGELTKLTDAELEKMDVLFAKISGAVGTLNGASNNKLPIDIFVDVVNSYRQPSRFFHSIGHLTDMTETHESKYQELAEAFISEKRPHGLTGIEVIKLQQINQLAAFFHDEEYTQVDGGLSQAGKKLLEDGFVHNGEGGAMFVSNPLPDNENSKLIGMVLDVFGIQPGEKLSPFNGMNELLSAMNAAISLNKAGISYETLVGVIASIEATVPFRDEHRMRGLRDRLDKLLPDQEHLVDMYVANATLLSNQDVINLNGGLVGNEEINADHVRVVMRGTDRLHQEEVGALRVEKIGAYPPQALLSAVNKQHNLFNGMLIPSTHHRVFHGMEVRESGKQYPAPEELQQANEHANLVSKHTGRVLRARVAALGLITSLASIKGLGETHISELLANCDKMPTNPEPEDGDPKKIAHEVLMEREVGPNDISRSAIADALLLRLSEDQLIQLVGDSPMKNSNITPIVQGQKGAAEKYFKAISDLAPEIVNIVNHSIEKHIRIKEAGVDSWVSLLNRAKENYSISTSDPSIANFPLTRS